MSEDQKKDDKQENLNLEDQKKKDDSKKVDLSALMTKISDLEKKLEEKNTKQSEDNTDKMLDQKVKDEAEKKAKTSGEVIALESALRFNLEADKFLEVNKSVLPENINKIFEQANKEKYDSAIEKANATKASIINEFFSLQANIDFLTPAQKADLTDFQKYTKKAKEEKADYIYKNIFEPTLENIKRVKKAEQIAKANSGFGEGSEFDAAYAKKMKEHSEKYYFRKQGE